MKTKRLIRTLLLVIWMIVIFLFSNQNANQSESVSDMVTNKMISGVEEVTKEKIPEKKKKEIVREKRFFIRKTAHFLSYSILGLLIYLTLESYAISHIFLYSVLFCFFYACSDEVHQLFLDGRTAKFMDVLIDTTGSITSCFLLTRFKRRNGKRKDKSCFFKSFVV